MTTPTAVVAALVVVLVMAVVAVEVTAVGVEDGNDSRFVLSLFGFLHSAGVLYLRYGDDAR